MATKRNKFHVQKTDNKEDNIKKKIHDIIDGLLESALKESMPDSFYTEAVVKMKAIDENCFVYVSKQFVKAAPREKEIFLKLFKSWTGVEHIKFLQEFIKRGEFWPRMGLIILELFNKHDAMLEEGLASRIVDLDALAQRIKQLIYSKVPLDEKDAQDAIEDFLKRDDREKEGIIAQMLDEVGTDFESFVEKILIRDALCGEKIIKIIGNIHSFDSLKILEAIYSKTRKREMVKIIKKLIHALKQKGMNIPEYSLHENTKPVFKKITLPEPQAFISSIDCVGDRLIFMSKPVTSHEHKLFQILFNDEKGIKDIEAIHILRKDAQQFFNDLMAEKRSTIIETTVDHAVFLVHKAYKINQKEGNIISGSFMQWNALFPDNQYSRTRPIIYDCLDAEKTGSKNYLLEKIEKIFEDQAILFWFVDTRESREYWKSYQEILNSPIVLNSFQKNERVNEFFRSVAESFFNQHRRIIFQRRLEETAYIYHKTGHEEKAEISFAAALSLYSDRTAVKKNPFCLSVIREGLKLIEYEENEGSLRKDELVIEPKDFSLLA